MRPARYITALCSAGLALLPAGFVLGQHAAPTDYHLVSEDVLATIDLAKEIDSVQNRELRLSRAVVSPGGHIGLHSHQGDPTVVYLLSGVLTNHRDDGTTEEFGPGQVFAEFGPRAHWVENKGATPVTFIVANIHRREYHPAVRPLQGNQAMAPITLREGDRLSTVARSSALRLECRR